MSHGLPISAPASAMGAGLGDGVEMMQKELRLGGQQQKQVHDFADPQFPNPVEPENDYNCDIISSLDISTPEGQFSLPPPVRGRDQLHALLRRQYLHKVSNLPDHFPQTIIACYNVSVYSCAREEQCCKEKIWWLHS